MTITTFLKKGVKKALPFIAKSIIINQALLFGVIPISTSIGSYSVYKIEVDEAILDDYKNLPENFGAYDYLNLANGIAHKFSNDRHDCKNLTITTYDLYHRLIEDNNRAELSDKVQLAAGVVRSGIGHMFLEIDSHGEFVAYDAVMKTPLFPPEMVSNYHSMFMLPSISDLSWILERSFKGTKCFYPTPSSFVYPGGFIRLLLACLNYKN